MASTDKDSFMIRSFGDKAGNPSTLVYLLNAACIGVMLMLNGISIKHMMKSIKHNGAFISGLLNFIFNFAVSVDLCQLDCT